MDRRFDSWEEERRFQLAVKEEVKNQRKKAINRVIILAIVFSLMGAAIGGAIVDMVASNKYESLNLRPGQTSEITINTEDSMGVGAAVAAKNLDAVVGISTTTTISDIFNRQYDSQAIGSGFIVDQEGYIVTNDHVIASLMSADGYSGSAGYADDIRVVFNDGEQVPAEVLWSDSTLDLAILKIEPRSSMTIVTLGDSDDLVIGEEVFAIGNPLALDFHGTFTGGYVSGLDRTLVGQGFSMSDLIQTDAAINGGNSGGPLFNSAGEVVGVNTAKIKSGEGLGFSIGINTVKPILQGIIENKTFERVSMGIYPEELYVLENYLGRKLDVEGVVVKEVIENTPADIAGLKSLDILTKIDDKSIATVDELMKALYSYRFGDTVTLEVYRDNELINLELTFDDKLAE